MSRECIHAVIILVNGFFIKLHFYWTRAIPHVCAGLLKGYSFERLLIHSLIYVSINLFISHNQHVMLTSHQHWESNVTLEGFYMLGLPIKGYNQFSGISSITLTPITSLNLIIMLWNNRVWSHHVTNIQINSIYWFCSSVTRTSKQSQSNIQCNLHLCFQNTRNEKIKQNHSCLKDLHTAVLTEDSSRTLL